MRILTSLFLALTFITSNLAAVECYMVDDKYSSAQYKVEVNRRQDVFVTLTRHSDRTEPVGIEFNRLYVGNSRPLYSYLHCEGYPFYYYGPCYRRATYPSEFAGQVQDSRIRLVGPVGERMVIYHTFRQADGKKHTHIAGDVSYCQPRSF